MFSFHGAVGGAKAWATVSSSWSRDEGRGKCSSNPTTHIPPDSGILCIISKPSHSQNLLEYPQKLDIAPSSPLWFMILVGSSHMEPNLPHVFHHVTILYWVLGVARSRCNHATNFQLLESVISLHSPAPQTPHLFMKSKCTLKKEPGSIFWKCKDT